MRRFIVRVSQVLVLSGVTSVVLLLGCSGSNGLSLGPSASQHAGGQTRAPDELPNEIRRRASQHIAAQQSSFLVWPGATLGRFAALYRPDVEGPAYYD
ncbi:MAG: hypothetical protein ACRD2L_00040, partial [Terriglobia bacterium]